MSFAYTQPVISIHALAKRATAERGNLFSICLFQSTPSQRGRRIEKRLIEMQKNFNPRPRKEGDLPPLVSVKSSVHFNPRPRKEGDAANTAIIKVYCHFNPRPRKEGDVLSEVSVYSKSYISIHALAKRATRYSKYQQAQFLFQSTPSQRGRLTAVSVSQVVSTFQSTPSQRGRLFQTCGKQSDYRFQSTPSQRGRQNYGLR